MLEALQNSAFSQWLLVSEYGYPIFLTLHSLGLAMLVGVLICIDLRVLGIARSIPLPPIKRLMADRVDRFRRERCVRHRAVRGRRRQVHQQPGLSAEAVEHRHRRRAGRADEQLGAGRAERLRARRPGRCSRLTAVAKSLAVVSIVVWIAAIGFGRYMAYE